MYSTFQAAKKIGVSKNTLLRWIADGLIEDVRRDWRGWRVWSQEDIDSVKVFKDAYHRRPIPRLRRRPVARAEYAGAFAEAMSQCAEGWDKRMRISS